MKRRKLGNQGLTASAMGLRCVEMSEFYGAGMAAQDHPPLLGASNRSLVNLPTCGIHRVAPLGSCLTTCRVLPIIRPMLPDFVDRLEVHRLQAGHARVNLRFERLPEGVAVKVLKVEGLLDGLIEPEMAMAPASEAGAV